MIGGDAVDIIEAITQLIANLGFPIACCIVLFKQNEKYEKVIEDNTAAIRELTSIVKYQHHDGLGGDCEDDCK